MFPTRISAFSQQEKQRSRLSHLLLLLRRGCTNSLQDTPDVSDSTADIHLVSTAINLSVLFCLYGPRFACKKKK
jgi:hypothetical protein